MEEAKGYRQPSPKTVQGPGRDAKGTPSETLRTKQISRGRKGNRTDKAAMQIGYGSNKKTRHMMPSGHKAFLVNNTRDIDLLLMHSRTFAAEYV